MTISLSFLGEEHKEIHKICGSKSGRDMDKVKATGLSPLFTENGSITFEQARLTFECKKLYANLISPETLSTRALRTDGMGNHTVVFTRCMWWKL